MLGVQYAHCLFHRSLTFSKSGAISYPFSEESKWLMADRMNLAKRSELERVDSYLIRDPNKETARIWLRDRKKLFGELVGLRKWLRLRKLQRFADLESQRRIQSDPFIEVRPVSVKHLLNNG